MKTGRYRKKILEVGVLLGIVLITGIAVMNSGRGEQVCSGREEVEDMNEEKETSTSSFAPIEVVDSGEALPANQQYTGLTCNIMDTFSETRFVEQSDGSLREEEVSTMRLNNVRFSVPEGGTRAFGVPIFSTTYPGAREREAKEQWHRVEGEDCPEFNAGMEQARKLILEGYFQKPLENFLSWYPEISPMDRTYRLLLTGGGKSEREEDDTSWWQLDYVLVTTGDDGEMVAVASIDITKVTMAQGVPVSDDAQYRIWSAESGYWKLAGEPAEDRGRIWISQMPEMDFTEEEQVRFLVEEQGAGFDSLLPSGADRQVEWDCRKKQGEWYDYLVWSGETNTYELTLAIPLMEQGAGGWYMASRIRKEAENKDLCHYTLAVMMGTFHEEPYVHCVKYGESLWSIYEKYQEECAGPGYSFRDFSAENGGGKPDLIYPGQYVTFR